MSNFTEATTCPYCWKTFRQAGPFDKHLRVSHADQAVCFYNRQSSRSGGFNALEKDQNDGRARSEAPDLDDFPINLLPEETEADLMDDSDAESECDEVYNELEDSQPTRRELYENSGRSYGCVLGEEERIRDLLRNPWGPFRNASEFKLARFFVEANVPWEQIEGFMKASLAPPDVYFTSAFTFRALLNNMDNPLGPESWMQGEAIFSGMKVPFYYRDPVACVKYLIRQKAYQTDLIYSPERLYEGEERQYGELHTADWWWDTQVSCANIVPPQRAYKNSQRFRQHFRKVQPLCQLSVPRIQRISRISRVIKRLGQYTSPLEISSRQHEISRGQWR